MVRKGTARGHPTWRAGPRIAQARHALERVRRHWTRSERESAIDVDEPPGGYRGAVLVLRALKSTGDVYRIDGPLAEIDAILNEDTVAFGEEGYQSIGEIFIDRIEPGEDGVEHAVPEGYGENGIWIRGKYDYSHSQVAGAIGTGMRPALIAWIGEATWVERRMALVDAREQVEAVTAQNWMFGRENVKRWRYVDEGRSFRYVNWIGTNSLMDPRTAPPVRMRLRCWYDVVVETARRKRIVLREEGLRGDDTRTASRAIQRWRQSQGNSNALVVVREIRIAKRQPRPMPPHLDERGNRA